MRTLSISTGRGNITLSRIVLGTTYIGTQIPRELSFAMMDLYYERGGRTIDCARIYGQTEDFGVSEAERCVGDWIESRGVRGEVALITKGGHPSLAGYPRRSRLSPAEIERDFADSLALLKTDAVDIYFLHRDDESIPVANIVDTLDGLVRSGRARAVGASNWRLERILEANNYARHSGKTPFAVSQIQWSLANCTTLSWGDDTLVFMDGDLHRRYLEAGLPVMAYSAQAKGLFSKYIEGGEAAVTPKARRFFSPENLRKIEAVRGICEKTGHSPAAVCLAYITCHSLPAVANIGASSLAQLEDSLSGADLVLGADDVHMLEEA